MTTRARRRWAVAAALLLAVALAACNPDPTTGRPPPPGEPVPPFEWSVHPVGPCTPYPLTHSWRPGCPVGTGDLRLVEATHWGYDGTRTVGRIVVHAGAIDGIAQVLRELYDARFQIERMQPVDDYGGDDGRSMEANNSSAFNCRPVAGTTRWSEHSYGTAVDLNPVQNPYVRGDTVEPPAGRSYTDRSSVTPGMIVDGDAVVTAFARIGWEWGGHWRSSKDYQHLSATGR